MATNDRNAPDKQGRTNGRKASQSNRDSFRHYLKFAPPETDIETIIEAYNSPPPASAVDWESFGGDLDE